MHDIVYLDLTISPEESHIRARIPTLEALKHIVKPAKRKEFRFTFTVSIRKSLMTRLNGSN